MYMPFRLVAAFIPMETATSDCIGQKWLLVQCYAEDYAMLQWLVGESSIGRAMEILSWQLKGSCVAS